MDARLVTVAREISSLNANIIRSRLEAEGIQCFVSGEKVSSVVGLPANVGAFIDVQVLDFDAARAQSILQEIAEAPRDEDLDETDENPACARSVYSVSNFPRLSFVFLICFNVVLTGILSGLTTNNWILGLLGGVLGGVIAGIIALGFFAVFRHYYSS